MRIKAKKTNSVSENAIRSSYFVIQSRKVMHLSRSTLSMKRMTLLHGYMCFFTVDVSTQKIKILTNHIIDQRPWVILNNRVRPAWLTKRPSCIACVADALNLLQRVFSLTWPAIMQIYWNKRKRLQKKGVQLPEDWFGTPYGRFIVLGHQYGRRDVM